MQLLITILSKETVKKKPKWLISKVEKAFFHHYWEYKPDRITCNLLLIETLTEVGKKCQKEAFNHINLLIIINRV